MTRIFHNPRCRKSRETLQLLEDKKEMVTIIEYLNTPPSKAELKEILEMLDMKPEQLLRKGEAIYKEQFKGKDLTDDQWIDAMIEYPKLMERPIVTKNGKAAIGRPPENVLDILPWGSACLISARNCGFRKIYVEIKMVKVTATTRLVNKPTPAPFKNWKRPSFAFLYV